VNEFITLAKKALSFRDNYRVLANESVKVMTQKKLKVIPGSSGGQALNQLEDGGPPERQRVGQKRG
jgi:hypothetical protein